MAQTGRARGVQIFGDGGPGMIGGDRFIINELWSRWSEADPERTVTVANDGLVLELHWLVIL